VRNRKREICTSGSARGEDGNILTYSALGVPDRAEEALEGALVGKACEMTEKQ
jgi:hypothetical protein